MTEPKISFILNTFCLDPVVRTRCDVEGRDYSEREEVVLEAVELAKKQFFDEVLVAGSFRQPTLEEGFRYLPHPPVFRTRADALYLREWGARNSTGHILVFSHDDHLLGPNFKEILLEEWPFDILVPKRETREGEPLNNGEEAGYMGGHILALSREAWAKVPWTSVESEWWDVSLSRIWREAGLEIRFSQDLVHIDAFEEAPA